MLNPQITLVGGLTIDLSYYVDEWPKVNQAVQAKKYNLEPGGKGLNQATAISRQGLKVNLISSIGSDNFANSIISALGQENISAKNVIKQANTKTDLIGIIVGPDSQPGFIGIKTANSKLNSSYIEENKQIITASSILTINSEVNEEVLATSLRIAKAANLITIFNPAPPEKFNTNLLSMVDYFIPNEYEAKYLIDGPDEEIEKLGQKYLAMGAKNVCITLAQNGCLVLNQLGEKRYGIYKVKEVDSTGAGDAFTAGVIFGLIQEFDEEKLFHYASAAGALACTKLGARASMPTRDEIQKFMQNHEIFPNQ